MESIWYYFFRYLYTLIPNCSNLNLLGNCISLFFTNIFYGLRRLFSVICNNYIKQILREVRLAISMLLRCPKLSKFQFWKTDDFIWILLVHAVYLCASYFSRILLCMYFFLFVISDRNVEPRYWYRIYKKVSTKIIHTGKVSLLVKKT